MLCAVIIDHLAVFKRCRVVRHSELNSVPGFEFECRKQDAEMQFWFWEWKEVELK